MICITGEIAIDRPVWLFSSGPLGTETTDAQGQDLRVTAGRAVLPAGDFRDWPVIEAWAEQIAGELSVLFAAGR